MKKLLIGAALCIALFLVYAGADIVFGTSFSNEQPVIHSSFTGTVVSVDSRSIAIRPIDVGEDVRTVQIRAGAKHKLSVQAGDVVCVSTTLNFNDTEFVNSLEILAQVPAPQASSIPKGE